jgi:hypothetical protein
MTNGSGLSEGVRRFIATYIPTVGHLEVLLLCHGQPNHAWSAKEVDAHLRSSVTWASERLEHLRAHGLLVEADPLADDGFRLAALPGPAKSDLDALAEAYRIRRVAVISEIYAAPQQRGTRKHRPNGER